jgi:hypothetical protein
MCFFNLAERAYLEQNDLSQIENYALQEVFLQKPNLICTGKPGGRCWSFYHRWFSLERCMCFFISAE